MKWFNYSEFDSPDEPGSGHNMDEEFLDMLDQARARAGIPFVITSGYRTEAHSYAVGSNANSSHCKGVAADIVAATSRDRYLILTALLEVGIDRLGIGEDYIHADVDWEKPANVIWNYS
jgi:zinc D-Ala-D-Ala carboxypeptidase